MKLFFLFSLLVLYAVQSLGQQYPSVYVVLFTHIEDNTPSADLGTPQARTQYVNMRNGMIEMAKLARRYQMRWSFQPDWKMLLAALRIEDSSLMSNTNGKNFLRFLREDLGIAIDPHSHEKQGYNYSDVACLLDSLGVGGSTVIGGHIWDPSLPQFQNWDRFRSTVAGTKYPWYLWRGDILMGSGTPSHVNDPCVTGVWRPKDRYRYFEDDPAGNVTAIGQYKGSVDGIIELVSMYRSGFFSRDKILTSSIHILPLWTTTPNSLKAVEDTIIKPLAALRDRGEIILTDFSELVRDWRSNFGGVGHIYDAKRPASVGLSTSDEISFDLYPNPSSGRISFRSRRSISELKISIYSILGIFLEEIRFDSTPRLIELPLTLGDGQYYIVIKAGAFLTVKRIIIRRL